MFLAFFYIFAFFYVFCLFAFFLNLEFSSLYFNKWLSYWTRYVFRPLMSSSYMFMCLYSTHSRAKAQSAKFGQKVLWIIYVTMGENISAGVKHLDSFSQIFGYLISIWHDSKSEKSSRHGDD